MPRRARGPRHAQGGGAPSPHILRERALALSPRSTFKPLGGVEVERFFRRGAPLPIFQALRCCAGAALLQRKEWRAAKARISLVVRRRCCPSSALELKKRRAANACEAGPRRLAMSPHLGMGGPQISWGMWQEGQPLCRGGQGASARTILRPRAARLPTLLHSSILGERMLPNKVASARGVHAMPAGVVGGGAYTPKLLQR